MVQKNHNEIAFPSSPRELSTIKVWSRRYSDFNFFLNSTSKRQGASTCSTLHNLSTTPWKLFMQSSAKWRWVEYLLNSFWYWGIFLIIVDKSRIDCLSPWGIRFESINFFKFFVTFLKRGFSTLQLYTVTIFLRYFIESTLTEKRQRYVRVAVPPITRHFHPIRLLFPAHQRWLHIWRRAQKNYKTIINHSTTHSDH